MSPKETLDAIKAVLLKGRECDRDGEFAEAIRQFSKAGELLLRVRADAGESFPAVLRHLGIDEAIAENLFTLSRGPQPASMEA